MINVTFLSHRHTPVVLFRHEKAPDAHASEASRVHLIFMKYNQIVHGCLLAVVGSLVVEILNSDHLRHKAMATFVLWGNETPASFYILSAAARMRLETSHNAPRSITFSSSVKPPVPPLPSMPSSLW